MLKLYLFKVTATHRKSKYGFCRLDVIAANNPPSAREILSDEYVGTRRQYDVEFSQLNSSGINIENIPGQKKIGGGWLNWEPKK